MTVVGARPQFVKAAVLSRLIREQGPPSLSEYLVHTGQHYDDNMSEVFFRQLRIPTPDVELGIGSGTHGRQTGAMLAAVEQVLVERQPNWVLVYGDTNSTLAGALAAAKLGIPVAHVEAGLRSFYRAMPEEINRVVTDSISDVLLVSEASGMENLRREGIAAEKTFFVGNVMIDSLVRFLEAARGLTLTADWGLEPSGYALVTMHRPSNVDDEVRLGLIVDTLERVAEGLPVVFPAHPRTVNRLKAAGLHERLASAGAVRLTQPLGYLEFLHLMDRAAVVLTDSGGIQEETTYLGVPCLTVRENTERPVTVEMGTNRLVALDPGRIPGLVAELNGRRPQASVPPLWDGHAAARIVDVLQARRGVR